MIFLRFLRRHLAPLLVVFPLEALATPDAAPTSRWEVRIQRYLDQDRTNPPPPRAIVFTGSSSIDAWRTLQEDFQGLPVVNRGIGGSGLADVLLFNERLVFPLKPKIIVIYSGENDLQFGVTVDQLVSSFEKVHAQIRRELPKVAIIFISLKPSPSRVALLAAMREANARIAALCAADNRCRFVDVFTPMLDEHGAPRRELFVDDQLHMNAEGYKLWTRIVGPVLRGD